ncbi:unnamed protein product, partial [Polarella glacialis]
EQRPVADTSVPLKQQLEDDSDPVFGDEGEEVDAIRMQEEAQSAKALVVAAAKEEEEAEANFTQVRPWTKSKSFSHRRVWTLDSAVSLLRGVVHVGVGDGESETKVETIAEE